MHMRACNAHMQRRECSLDEILAPASRAPGEYNYTGLMWAAVRGKTDLAKVLLDAGADTEAVNAWGRTALFIATWEGHTRIVIEMVHAGANVSSGADHDEWTALHKASEMGNSELVRDQSGRHSRARCATWAQEVVWAASASAHARGAASLPVTPRVASGLQVRILLEAGADPTQRTLPDKSFPTGVTAMDVTGNEQACRTSTCC
jgi:hypothetical protein